MGRVSTKVSATPLVEFMERTGEGCATVARMLGYRPNDVERWHREDVMPKVAAIALDGMGRPVPVPPPPMATLIVSVPEADAERIVESLFVTFGVAALRLPDGVGG